MVVLLGAVALVASALWWLWRRRQLALAGPEHTRYWKDERTLYATYEDLGLARGGEGAEAEAEDATACLNMGEVVAEVAGGEAESEDATACLNMDEVVGEAADATACLNMSEIAGRPPTTAVLDLDPKATAFVDMREIMGQPPRPASEPPPPAPEPAPSPASEPPAPAPSQTPSLAKEPPAPASAPAPAPAPGALGIGAGELASHFEAAVEACARWREAMADGSSLEAVAAGPERAWLDAMALLETGNLDARDSLLRPALREASEAPRRLVAGLALLTREDLELSTLLDEHPLDELHDALLLWRGARVEARLRGAALDSFPDQAPGWTKLLAERGLDPGAELLGRLLEAEDPELAAAGFELLALHDDPEPHRAKVMARMFDPHPGLRAAAIEAGLRLRLDVAWVHCRQQATTSRVSRGCELAALLSAPAEQAKLVEWASRSSAPAHALWCAALSGRVAAVELALAALAALDRREDLARRCLVHLLGPEASDSSWWRDNASRFEGDHRWLAGTPYALDSVRRGLAELGPPHRAALALELGVRAPQLPRIPLAGFAHELVASLARLDAAEIDFELGYPWTR